MTKVIVKYFSYKGERLLSLRPRGRYMAINTKDIDANGKLTRTYWGAHNTIADCIEVTMRSIDIKELVAGGMDPIEASTAVLKQMMGAEA